MIKKYEIKFFLLSFLILLSPKEAFSENNDIKNDVTIYDSWDIPHNPFPKPNLNTLRFYLKRHLDDPLEFDKLYSIRSQNPKILKFDSSKSKILNREIQKSSILSYLFWDNGVVKYDMISPPDRLGNLYKNETRYRSNSIGKSLVSYLIGHAICEGFIESIESKLSDWPILKTTIYEDQKLIDLLNMQAGDQELVDDNKGLSSTGRWYNVHSIRSFAERELKNTKRDEVYDKPYHYNGLITNILFNYIIFKTGDNFQGLMGRVFREKVGIDHSVYFFKNKYKRRDNSSFIEPKEHLGTEDGNAWYMFYATRYDYLRTAVSIMKDWQDGGCVGNYIQDIYENRIPKNYAEYNRTSVWKNAKSYGGQFHFDLSGLENRKIISMDGYGNQSIVIDSDNSRIVVLNTIYGNYNWEDLVYKPIKFGFLQN
jgi:CubicO group peptidase (beta-lactamase class C family)